MVKTTIKAPRLSPKNNKYHQTGKYGTDCSFSN